MAVFVHRKDDDVGSELGGIGNVFQSSGNVHSFVFVCGKLGQCHFHLFIYSEMLFGEVVQGR